MDHTAFNLQRTPCQPLYSKRSPDGASTKCGGEHLIAAQYSFIDPRKDERLSWPGRFTYSGRLTHISGHPSAICRAQDGERTLARDCRSTAESRGPTVISDQMHFLLFLVLIPTWPMHYYYVEIKGTETMNRKESIAR